MKSTRSLSWIERALGAEPLSVPPHVFYLGPDALLYAQVDTAEGVSVGPSRVAELEPETFLPGQLGGPLKEPEAFTELLRGLVSEIGEIDSASLVLPDAWYRLVFAEVDQLPSAAAARDEALRWKLKRLVPFRVEDLRLDAVNAVPLAGQEDPGRVMIGFAAQALLEQCEAAFAAAGIRLGAITNVTLSVAHLIEPVAANEIGLLLVAQDDGYSLLASLGEAPVLYRYKPLDAGAGAGRAQREMLLTSRFLEERLAHYELSRVVVVGSDRWSSVVGESLGIEPQVLEAEDWRDLLSSQADSVLRAALVGAAHVEVA
ncbi:MAG: hypothetical protein AAGK22_15535 [Acidobacteriota bacterium]